jgi:uncharacterized delta-60 repeat protein
MSKRVRTTCGAQARFELLEERPLCAAGAPDPSFSGDGRTTVDFLGGLRAFATDAAVQKDGKTVVVGFVDAGGGTRRFAVARLNFDGTPDTSFDGDGLVVVPVGDIGDARATAVAVQGDGKIVVAGSARMDSLGSFNGPNFAVIRLLPNGRLDNTFDGDGKRTINFAGGATDVALQSDGKIVIVGDNFDSGFLGFGGDFNFAVARLHPNGSLDQSFSNDGKQQIGFGGDDHAEAVAISGGKIIVAGRSGSEFGSSKMAIVRLNGNGNGDTTFGPSGNARVLTAFPGQAVSSARDLLVQSGGKIVVAGTSGNPANPGSMQFALTRFLSTGAIDTSFGGSGSGIVATDLGGNDVGLGIMQAAGGGLIVAGSSDRKFALSGYTADGALDPRFGNAGKLVTDFGLVDTTFGIGLAKGTGMRRFVVAGGSQFSTARFLDANANVVSVGSLDPNAAEQGRDPASLLVTRTERLPLATRVFFSIGGTALGPTADSNRIDYDLAGMDLPRNAPAFVDIPAGQTFAQVLITPRDDARRENRETASFTIQPDATYVLGTNPSATVRITDNDGPAAAASAARATAQPLGGVLGGVTRSLFSMNPIDELTARR